MTARLCLVTKIWNSGTGWFAAALADGLAKAGASVTFIAPPMRPDFREPAERGIKRIIVPRELEDCPSRLRSMASKAKRITLTLLAITCQLFRSDSFLFTMPDHEIVSIPTFLMLRLFGKKVIYVVHDPVPHDFAFARHQQFTLFLIATRYRVASALVVLSEAGKQKLISEFHIDPRKIHVIPHGAFGFADQSKIPGQRVLLAFGSIRKNKNVLMVIEAIKLARASGLEVKLMVAGGYDAANPYCQECLKAITADPAGFIDKTGYIEDADIPGLIAQTDAFILAYSDFDSQSGVAVLAGVNGRPVIGTFAGGVRELKPMGLAGTEIRQPVTPAAIAEAIQEFYKTPLAQWQTEAETGRTQLAEQLDWTRIAGAYLEI